MAMREIKAVIGKNFGDEGKGRMVDLLCGEALERGRTALVVRHNGGAQAGHTVEDGKFRFVFHQLGSGSRLNVPVYWSNTFLPDLLKLGEEVEEFRAQPGVNPLPVIVYADPDCTCVTIYDVLLNSLAESLRGMRRHGSCGMGIYETVLRKRKAAGGAFAFCLGDLENRDPERIARMMRVIRDEYVPERVREIFKDSSEVPFAAHEWLELIGDDNLLLNSAEIMWENFNRFVRLTKPGRLFDRYDTVLFENAQGLLLDEDNRAYFPHLTPSHTGLLNVRNIVREAESDRRSAPFSSFDVHYVTRTYVTRHGPGQLDYECPAGELNTSMQDRTNRNNRWQGRLRYAKHPSGSAFWGPVLRDFQSFGLRSCLPARLFMDVTHMDETEDQLIFSDHRETRREFLEQCRRVEAQGCGAEIIPRFFSSVRPTA